MVKIKDVTEALTNIDHELAHKWQFNDLIKKNLATSYEYWLEDTGIPIPLKDYILQYIENAPFLGGIFTLE